MSRKKQKALPTQLALRFDRKEGQRRAQQGTEQALYATAALPWVQRAERWLAVRVDPFTSEHLVEAIGLPDGQVGMNKNNAVGALVRAWAQRKCIDRVGYSPARRVESHGALLSVWRRRGTPDVTLTSGQ